MIMLCECCECTQDDYVLLNTIVDDLTSPNYSNVQLADTGEYYNLAANVTDDSEDVCMNVSMENKLC
jgi:hypothetical protein